MLAQELHAVLDMGNPGFDPRIPATFVENCSMRGCTASCSNALVLPVTMKSSAQRLTFTCARVPRRVFLG